MVDVPDWAPPTAAMVGLGVGIDYALLIVTRFRSNLAEGQEPRPATVSAIATAGRAVVFAGFVVIVSMLGILLVGLASLNGFAFTVSLAVLFVMAASMTLLPALLGFTGRNIERLHVPFVGKDPHTYDTSRWYRWSRFIQRRPWVAAIGGLAVLLALAAPFLGLRLGFPDAQNDPPSYTTKKAYDLLADGFGPGFSAPIVLTVQGASDGELLKTTDALGEQLAEVDGVVGVSPAVVNEAGDTAVLTLVATTSPQDQATEDLVDVLRDTAVPDADHGHRPERRRRRYGGREPRHHPGRRRPAAALLRRGAAGVVPTVDDGVPLRGGPAQGRGHEPARQRRRFRSTHAGGQRWPPG